MKLMRLLSSGYLRDESKAFANNNIDGRFTKQ